MYEMLLMAVRSGCSVVLERPIEYDVLREIVAIARTTGAHVTLPVQMDYKVLEELIASGGKQLTLIYPKD